MLNFGKFNENRITNYLNTIFIWKNVQKQKHVSKSYLDWTQQWPLFMSVYASRCFFLCNLVSYFRNFPIFNRLVWLTAMRNVAETFLTFGIFFWRKCQSQYSVTYGRLCILFVLQFHQLSFSIYCKHNTTKTINKKKN